MYTSEFDVLVQQCIRAMEGSTYETRCAIVPLLGRLVAGTQKRKPSGKKSDLFIDMQKRKFSWVTLNRMHAFENFDLFPLLFLTGFIS